MLNRKPGNASWTTFSRAKDLTGGDVVSARRMREDFWRFNPTHKIILCTNHKPSIKGTDHAIWRRVRLVPFAFTIPEKERDKNMLAKLRTDLSGIFAWCVRGCLEWQGEGLGLPEAVKAATAAYRDEQDVIGEFLSECCVTGPEYRVKAAHLYGTFVGWCKTAGEADVPQREFGNAMTERGIERFTSNGTWYRGIAVSQVMEPTEPSAG
ncbi:MAG: phage/plasmid primase, P4 family [Gemmataceae bacterium]|nr:phage/plasmid primase, P4 family [Gemmataceae bacterium]